MSYMQERNDLYLIVWFAIMSVLHDRYCVQNTHGADQQQCTIIIPVRESIAANYKVLNSQTLFDDIRANVA